MDFSFPITAKHRFDTCFKRKIKNLQSKCKQKQQKPPCSWDQIKNLFTCTNRRTCSYSLVTSACPSKIAAASHSKLGSSCNSICRFKDVVHRKTRVVHKVDNSPVRGTVSRNWAIESESCHQVLNSVCIRVEEIQWGSTYSYSSKGMQL
ncbi:hypothetical protein CJ030_MR1G019574 [Morella rubra]|uniref:Uncharacterized protein n=1 Tax=Morella rubra TaxID=262757 RepID=A0A6A1WLV2_9ROSI|nr:hypothetical protein CJ030_MR1G019574 [Morella rubra]